MKKICFTFVVTIALIASSFAQNAAAPAPAGEKFNGRTLTMRDFGSDDLGFLSLPETAPTIGVLVVHDSMGMNDNVKRYCDALAASGYVALAVDLYNGKIPEDKDQSLQFQSSLIKTSAIKIIEAGVLLLAESPQWKTERIVVISFGRQCELSLEALKKPRKEVSGMAWIEPEGEMDDSTFKRSSIPLKIVAIGKPTDENAFLSHVESVLSPEKKKLVFIERYVGASKGFFIASRKTDQQTKARNSTHEFWKACSDGKYQDQRNVFQKWLDKLD